MSIGISLYIEIIVLKICSDLSASVLSSSVVPSNITTIVKTIEKKTYNRASMESETTAWLWQSALKLFETHDSILNESQCYQLQDDIDTSNLRAMAKDISPANQQILGALFAAVAVLNVCDIIFQNYLIRELAPRLILSITPSLI